MKTIVRFGLGAIMLLLVWGCGASRSASSVQNDTYLSAKDRARLAQQTQPSSSTDVDARADNYEEAERPRRDWDDDYCYSCRVRRYSTGVWYDPWFDPWFSPMWGWRSAWWGPAWAGWGPWWGVGWTAMPGWYYSPWWGWTYYAGPVWYYDRGWTFAPSRRPNYMPRTYGAPQGGTIYRPPRSSSGSFSTPPRRTASPSYSPSGGRPSLSPEIRSMPSSGGARPSISVGNTGGGGIRTSSGAARPR
ncbi:MAG: hypothetical protein N2253_05895 [Bacteroidia bacterium]|nr:hypothetical protein [Bacteroidia bacterium]MCX7764405.1 hypothetical protein [Bacteroidia bacterium]MDW8056692.1 hypothetical protein [Bacteroidia bacterium]